MDAANFAETVLYRLMCCRSLRVIFILFISFFICGCGEKKPSASRIDSIRDAILKIDSTVVRVENCEKSIRDEMPVASSERKDTVLSVIAYSQNIVLHTEPNDFPGKMEIAPTQYFGVTLDGQNLIAIAIYHEKVIYFCGRSYPITDKDYDWYINAIDALHRTTLSTPIPNLSATQ